MNNETKNKLIETYLEEYDKGNIDEKEAFDMIMKIIQEE